MRPISATALLTSSAESTFRTRVVMPGLAAASSLSFPSLMSVAITLAPALRNAFAEASPMPCAAAVMSTILPLRSAMLVSRNVVALS